MMFHLKNKGHVLFFFVYSKRTILFQTLCIRVREKVKMLKDHSTNDPWTKKKKIFTHFFKFSVTISFVFLYEAMQLLSSQIIYIVYVWILTRACGLDQVYAYILYDRFTYHCNKWPPLLLKPIHTMLNNLSNM